MDGKNIGVRVEGQLKFVLQAKTLKIRISTVYRMSKVDVVSYQNSEDNSGQWEEG